MIVREPNGELSIYGYSKDDFPPTDFHTATLFENRIVLIGGLGYPDERKPGSTPVFALDTKSYRIERLETASENPGWIFEHTATLDPSHQAIVVSDGKIHTVDAPDNQPIQNADRFELNVRDWLWRRLKPNWEQNP